MKFVPAARCDSLHTAVATNFTYSNWKDCKYRINTILINILFPHSKHPLLAFGLQQSNQIVKENKNRNQSETVCLHPPYIVLHSKNLLPASDVDEQQHVLTAWRKENNRSVDSGHCVSYSKRRQKGLAASVVVLVAFSGWRLFQEGIEGGADGTAPERLLHTEVVHHALLHILLGWGEKKAPEDSQL